MKKSKTASISFTLFALLLLFTSCSDIEHEHFTFGNMCIICGEEIVNIQDDNIEENSPAEDAEDIPQIPEENEQETSPDQTAPELQEKYTVTYESEGTENIIVNIAYGESFEFPSVERDTENYIFLKWIDKETGETVTAGKYPFKSDKTFVAVWDKLWSDGY